MDDGVQLVERGLIGLFWEEMIVPWLYSPIRCLDRFISDNRHLLTIFGVFGAVGVYLSTVQDEIGATTPILRELAIVSALSLVTLIAIILVIKLWVETRKAGRWESVGLLLFGVFFIPLVFVVSGLLTQFRQVWAAYFFMGTYMVGIVGGFAPVYVVVYSSAKLEDRFEIPLPIILALSQAVLALGAAYLFTIAEIPQNTIIQQITSRGPIPLSMWGDLTLLFALGSATLFSVGTLIIASVIILLGMLVTIGLFLLNLARDVSSRVRSD